MAGGDGTGSQDQDQDHNMEAAITEDEAALYDRQIRLWGLEAQQRMRNATILIVTLRGTATEVIKNIVLAGIGKLVVMDDELVSEEDLGAGFLFREEDVGKKRVEAAKTRIEGLNPLVNVQVVVDGLACMLREPEKLDSLVQSVDLVCVTEQNRSCNITINEVCRRWGKMFYAGGSYGMLGYIFCDLLDHSYIAPERVAPKEPGAPPKSVKYNVKYTALAEALTYSWKSLTKRQTKELRPNVVFKILALWELQNRNDGALPTEAAHASQLEKIANDLVSSATVNQQVLKSIPLSELETVCATAAHEFSPVCAVVGGLLAQDMLKALSSREPPLANLFTFDGDAGSGTVCRMNMGSPVVI